MLNYKDYEILTPDGWSDFLGVKVNKGRSHRKIYLEDESFIDCTYDHKIYVNKYDKTPAYRLKVNDTVETQNGKKKVVRIESYKKSKKKVYDVLDVKGGNKFFANGVTVSNCIDFWNANYPSLSSSLESKVVIISTPNGSFNLFADLYKKAEAAQNEFTHMKITWDKVPGRDKKWAEVQIRNMGEEAFRQEFNCEFILGAVNTVVNARTLQDLLRGSTKDPFLVDLNGRLRILERPLSGARYIIACDPAKGTGAHDSTAQVLKVVSLNPIRFEQVAVFQDNKTDVYNFSAIINKLSIYYNNAMLFVENNGEGAPVIHHLWYTFENPNLYNTGQKEASLGIRAGKGTKHKAVLRMKRMLENDELIVRDHNTVMQLSEFIETEDGKYKCRDGMDDDLVSALYWGCYSLDCGVFDDDDGEYNEEQQASKKDEDEVWGILSDVSSSADWDF